MVRAALFLPMVLLFAATGAAAEPASPAAAVVRPASASAPGRFDRVIVAPTRTSIYVGVVSLSLPPLVRHGTTYSAPYEARVLPYFFSNESGTLSVDVSDAQLEELAQGRPIEFTGRGLRDDGEERQVTGKATPADATSGKLKVRVRVSKRIELIFNTTYRFAR